MAVMRRALVAWALILVAISAVVALDFPTLDGRVVDEAGVLDAATRSSLTEKLAGLEARTTDQLVVVTLKSLQGTTIEDFGVQLGRAWKVGQKDKNNGALLIVVPSERKVRIEVGYGLEGTLTDAITKLIIEGVIIPRFRADDFAGGISQGADAIIDVLTGGDRTRLTAILDAQAQLQRQQDIATEQRRRDDERAAHNRTALFWIGGFMLLWCTLFVRMAVIQHRKLKGHMRPLSGAHYVLGASAAMAGQPRPGAARSRRRSRSSSDSSSDSRSSSSSDSSSSSSSSDSSSGGGGDFGGGGASGSW
jgi:uncharacterized protein